ncbi:E3 ubiquitin-protein ligase ATL4-like [Rutidosis leptorrhynchoides]|uniref:E3 ubiquitin-protein ligase ATL4-like n=1 Tax=Rutidosis leptorrhynchoides TaxID=125765 RepID=UPI003A9A1A89
MATPPPMFFGGGGGGGSNNAAHSSSSSSPSSFSPSLTIIGLILAATVIISIGICLLLRHINRRCIRHLSAVSDSSSASNTSVAPVDSLRRSSRRISPETVANSASTASNSVIDSLPVFTFASITRRNPSTLHGGDCAVCLSKFEANDQLRLLPLCCHAFHLECIDTWLATNQTCPLCRSPLHKSDSEILKAALASSNDTTENNSFRLQIGSLSRRRQSLTNSTDFGEPRLSSYSIGSFDYVVDEESEIFVNQTHRRSGSEKDSDQQPVNSMANNLAADVGGGGRSWRLHDYVDRLSSLSSRALSFRSSGRFFTGSSRRTEIIVPEDYDLEGNRVGEEISEMFRWFSGV